MTTPLHVTESIEAYLAGGLDAAERSAFESHIAECGLCADVLAAARRSDENLHAMFSPVRPASDFEQRIVERLQIHAAPRVGGAMSIRSSVHPLVRRVATGVAAAIVLGAVGFGARNGLKNQSLPGMRNGSTLAIGWAVNSPQGSRVKAASNLRQLGTTSIEGLLSYAPGRATSYDEGRGLQRNEAVELSTPAAMAKQQLEETRGHFESRTGKATGYLELKSPQGPAVDRLAAQPRQRAASDTDSDGLADIKLKDASIIPSAATPAIRQLQQAKDAVRTMDRGSSSAGENKETPLQLETLQAKEISEFRDVQNRTSEFDSASRGRAFNIGGIGAKDNIYEDSSRPHFTDAPNFRFAEKSEMGGGKAGGGEQDKKAPLEDPLLLKRDRETTALADRPQLGEVRFAQAPPSIEAPSTPPALAVPPVASETPPAPAPEPAPATPPPAAAPDPLPDLLIPQRKSQPPAPAPMQRKIIRNGQLTFEVDSFDSSLLQITKIAGEEGGFIATTDSEKLANGKVKGTVTIRVPPDRLDTLVLKLRGLGDLKSQKIAADDVTKHYTDIDSQLRAAKAMQERLLQIIKDGKGAIKDLLEAEKQLGVWREKIESLEGEIRYFDNLIAFSTLNVTLMERDVKTPTSASESEQVQMGVETDDVEQARGDALKAIETAKGRVVESDMKQFEAGQFAATVTADVPPEAAGPLIDRLKQLGKVARFDVSRKTTTQGGAGPLVPGLRIERKDTRFQLSFYNLANIAPRQNTNLNLAAPDVEVAFRTIVDQVKSAGGRVVTSQLTRPKADQTVGTITFQVPTEKADVVLGAIRGGADVMRLEVVQNADTQNTTEAKRGFAVQIFSLVTVPARESVSLNVAVRRVTQAFDKLLEASRTSGGRIITSQLSEQDPSNVTGIIELEAPRENWPKVEAALNEAGIVVNRTATRSSDTENTVDSKLRLKVTLFDESHLTARETVSMNVVTSNVGDRYAKALDALRQAGAQVHTSQLAHGNAGEASGKLEFTIRRDSRAAIEEALSKSADVFNRDIQRAADAPNVADDRIRMNVTISDAGRQPPRQTYTLAVEVSDVGRSRGDVEAAAIAGGGRVIDFTRAEDEGKDVAKLVLDVPLARSGDLVNEVRKQGRVTTSQLTRNEAVPEGSLSRARIEVTLGTRGVVGEASLWDTIRDGLRTSIQGLLVTLQYMIVGLCLIGPWVLLAWGGWRMVRRAKARGKSGIASEMPSPT